MPEWWINFRLKRPVRCMFDRDEDMGCSGTRHPFFCRFKVGVKNDGRVMALKMTLYNNGGNSLDLSCSVMERALFRYPYSCWLHTLLYLISHKCTLFIRLSLKCWQCLQYSKRWLYWIRLQNQFTIKYRISWIWWSTRNDVHGKCIWSNCGQVKYWSHPG